ncbi:MAG: cysteine hydrolase [Deltaproteobacteria bacterium]|nr:cysteine hydrolase [Deltaproteobacteria bacterium]MBW1977962.1 cysteine hydrolase [Deltaproteobacteria bacterium]MBW2045984.1 cysteine hydrolase [Deltaproteobacteria bacterium]MBW2301329.1 cysteine hydrolase [Deltaproteobacteria bacterium]
MREEILRNLDEQVKPEHTALLIIDPQNDFCATNGAVVKLMGWDAARIQKAIKPLNSFILKARDLGVMRIWTRSLVDPARARSSSRARSFVVDADARGIEFAKQGARGSDWYSELMKPLADEYVVTKYHYDAFADTDLELLLDARGIKTLLLTGFMTNVCVETTARHGYIKGYYVILLSDCTEAGTEEEYRATLYNIKTYFGKVASSAEIIKIWEMSPSP